jgi:hypothetical protein
MIERVEPPKPVARNIVTLTNAHYTLRFNKNQGGCCTYLAPKGKLNIVDTYDDGRLFGNRSAYGSHVYGSWNKRPWQWNPVQGGNWTSESDPKYLGGKLGVTPPSYACSVTPVIWSTGELATGVKMDQKYTLEGEKIIYESRIRASGDVRGWEAGQESRHQEEPAFFLNRQFHELRTGGGRVTLPSLDAGPAGYGDVRGGWLGLTAANGYGLYMLCPEAELWTGYTTGRAAAGRLPATVGSCAYMAPLRAYPFELPLDRPIRLEMCVSSWAAARRILNHPLT